MHRPHIAKIPASGLPPLVHCGGAGVEGGEAEVIAPRMAPYDFSIAKFHYWRIVAERR
jgi:hypothetical protein